MTYFSTTAASYYKQCGKVSLLNLSHFQGLIPVKWAALEALQQQIYTSKSDV